jgi:uncharacterized protein (UPF0332 family)
LSRDFKAELVRLRLQQAAETIADARSLLETGRTTRSIINRAYYAMFYAVLALLQATGKVASKHSGVISLFDREFVRPGTFPKELSQALHEAFGQRQEFDYKPVSNATREEAAALVARAQGFLESVTSYLDRNLSS